MAKDYQTIIDKVLAENPNIAKEAKNGMSSFNFLVGLVSYELKGKADIMLVEYLLMEALDK